MAEKTHAPKRTSDQLIAEIARNRIELAAHRAGLRHASQVGDRLQRSFKNHAAVFFGTAAVAGVLLSLIPRVRGGTTRQEKRLHRREKEALAAAKKLKSNDSKSFAAVLVGLAAKAAVEMGKPVVLKLLREHYAKQAQHPPTSQSPRRDARVPLPTHAVTSRAPLP